MLGELFSRLDLIRPEGSPGRAELIPSAISPQKQSLARCGMND